MTLRLTLLAHAATEAQRRGVFPSPDDAIVAHPGLAPIRPGDPLSAAIVRCSPARAARQTAEMLALDPGIEPALADLDPGAWAGRSLAEVASQTPERLAAWLADTTVSAPDGEAMQDLWRRVGPWLDRCAALGTPVLAVTHAAVVRVAVAGALGADIGVSYGLDIAPLTRTVLSHRGRWRLQGLGLPL